MKKVKVSAGFVCLICALFFAGGMIWGGFLNSLWSSSPIPDTPSPFANSIGMCQYRHDELLRNLDAQRTPESPSMINPDERAFRPNEGRRQ